MGSASGGFLPLQELNRNGQGVSVSANADAPPGGSLPLHRRSLPAGEAARPGEAGDGGAPGDGREEDGVRSFNIRISPCESLLSVAVCSSVTEAPRPSDINPALFVRAFCAETLDKSVFEKMSRLTRSRSVAGVSARSVYSSVPGSLLSCRRTRANFKSILNMPH